MTALEKAERIRLRRLANDAIVDLFGVESRELKLAEALEACVEDLDRHAKCPVCGDNEEPDWAGLAAALEGLGFRLEPL